MPRPRAATKIASSAVAPARTASGRYTNRSISAPTTAARRIPATAEGQNGNSGPRNASVYARYAASVYVNPYAKWKRPVTPRMSANPTPSSP
jgi:hypothetical protein